MLAGIGTAVGALSGVVLLFAMWALLVGTIGMLSKERVERCPRCHRLGLTEHGRRHPHGCPSHLVHLHAVASDTEHAVEGARHR